jgi:hypothetical protein
VQYRWTGNAVPVWVVSMEGLLATLSDGVVTIGELEALQPIEGTAMQFNNVV